MNDIHNKTYTTTETHHARKIFSYTILLIKKLFLGIINIHTHERRLFVCVWISIQI